MTHKPLFDPNDYRKVVTFPQLVELTGIKKTTLRTWLRHGMIPAFRSGRGRRWQFKRDDLEVWWKKMHEQSPPRKSKSAESPMGEK
jgi:excisionase family DNA binding protein